MKQKTLEDKAEEKLVSLIDEKQSKRKKPLAAIVAAASLLFIPAYSLYQNIQSRETLQTIQQDDEKDRKLEDSLVASFLPNDVSDQKTNYKEGVSNQKITSENIEPDFKESKKDSSTLELELNKDSTNEIAALNEKSELEGRLEDLDTSQVDDPSHQFNLGVSQFEQGNYEEAEEHLKSAIELDPMEERYHRQLGVIYQNLGRLKDAITEFQISHDIEPENLETSFNLAFTYLKLEDFGNARAYLADLFSVSKPKSNIDFLGRTPNKNPLHNYLLAQVFANQGSYDDALKVLNRMESEVKGDENFREFGHLTEKQFDLRYFRYNFENIRELYAKFIEIDDKNPVSHFNMAQAQRKMGNFKLAEFYMENSDRLEPRVDKRVWLADMNEDQGDLERTLNYFDKALELGGSEQAGIILAKAKIFEEKGDYEKAVLNYQTLIDSDLINEGEKALVSLELGVLQIRNGVNDGLDIIDRIILSDTSFLEELFVEGSPIDGNSLNEIAEILWEEGEKQENLRFQEYAVEVYFAGYEKNDRGKESNKQDIDTKLSKLAYSQLEAGQNSDAAKSYERFFDFHRSINNYRKDSKFRNLNARHLNNAGVAYHRIHFETGDKNHLELAKEYFEQAKEGNGNEELYKSNFEKAKEALKSLEK